MATFQTGYKARRIASKTAIYIILLFVAAVCLVPFLWMVSTSLKSSKAIFLYPPQWIPNPPNWRNYYDTWTIVPFGTFFRNTVTIAVLCTVGTIIASSLAAFGFARLKFKGRGFLFAVMLATMMIPWEITAVPLYVEFKFLGWIDTLKPLIVPSFFGSAFNIFLLRQFLYSVPYDLDEAALIDGCGPFRTFFRVILPQLPPVTASVAILTGVTCWNDYQFSIYILSKQNPVATITQAVSGFFQQVNSDAYGAAAAALLGVLPIIALFLLLQRYFIQGMVDSAIK